MSRLSNAPARVFFLLTSILTIGAACPILQAQTDSRQSVEIERCRVLLIHKVKLAASVPGVLEFVTPGEGDLVEAEQEVAGLQDDVILAQKAIALKEAENDVEKRFAVKSAEVADAEYSKAQEANRRLERVVADVEMQRLKLAAERAHLQIEQAEHQLEVNQLKADEAEANLKTHRIKAPFKGVVTEKFKSRGEAVRQGENILEIISTDEVKVVGDVTLEESVRLNRGDRVKVVLSLAGKDAAGNPREKEFDGVLKMVAPEVNPVSGKIRVMAFVQNPDNILKAGLTAKMTIFPQKSDSIETTLLDR